eukprot:EG_transcript_25421
MANQFHKGVLCWDKGKSAEGCQCGFAPKHPKDPRTLARLMQWLSPSSMNWALAGTEVQVNSLVDVPTKKESIEKIARLLKGIPQKIAMSIKATPRKVAVAIRLATYGDTDPTKATA